ncbi:MAG: HAMP domain-containing protein [Methanomicrobiales archaeon]|nr:HAMP domain-containing protein [Methanomicrobiales archaeon]
MNPTSSLVTRFTAVFLVIIILISGIAAFVTFDVAGGALRESIRDELMTSAGIMATQVNASEILPLKPGDEGSPAYIAVARHLATMRSANDEITNAYIMYVDDNQVISFVVDDFWLEDPGQAARIGEVYPSPDREQIFMALSVPAASENVYTDKWGTFISGYAPIRDENGNTVAVLGIDVEASDLPERVSAVRNAYIALMGSLILAGTLAVFLLSRSLARDIQQLTSAVEEMQAGARTVEIDTRRNDELGSLARAIARLEELIR